MKRLPALHPFLFALYPVLFLASHNANETPLTDAILPLGAMLVFALALLLLFRFFFRQKEKSEILVSVFLLLFFSFGHVYETTQHMKIGALVVGRYRYLLAVWLVLFCGSAYCLARTRKNVSGLGKFLSFLSICLILLPAISIGAHSLPKLRGQTPVALQNSPPRTPHAEAQIGNHTWSDKQHVGSPEAPLRDIYYIILDMYGGSIGLKERLDYANDEFLNYLKNKGFYVAERSYSNYAQTYLSLSSSLNMRYIHDTTGNNADSNNLISLAKAIKDNEVCRFLKSQGYRYIHFGSRWGPTRYNDYADINMGLVSIIEQDDFSRMLMDTSMLSLFYAQYRYTIMREKDLYAFAKFSEIPAIKGPKFVFAHFLLPHPPFIFGSNGEEIVFTESQLARDRVRYRKYYLEQMTFLNKKLQSAVDEILAKSTIPPIIVIQGDHGMEISAEERTQGDYTRRMSILNVYYLPHNGHNLLYDSISPVNSFRLIFRHYFDAQYDLLHDKSFYSTYDRPFKFIEISRSITNG